MNRKIPLAEGEYYHIYNRGVEKRDIFLDDADRSRFQSLLYLCNGTNPIVHRLIQGGTLYSQEVGERLVAIGAYKLMPNHFHILVKGVTESGVTSFMRKLTTGYTMYFNKKYERVGPLFQGTFKAEHVTRDEHLKYLFAYIHLNIVKSLEPNWKEDGIRDLGRAKEKLNIYRFSSYFDYIGRERDESRILTKSVFPLYFNDAHDMETFVDEWLTFEL